MNVLLAIQFRIIYDSQKFTMILKLNFRTIQYNN